MKSTLKNITLQPFENARIDKLEILTKLGKGEYFANIRRPMLSEKIALCTDWLDLDKDELKEVSVKSIEKLYSEVVKLIGSHKPRPPRKSIHINGTKYVFVKRFADMSAAWHELVRRSDFKNNPIRMASLCYIEQGMTYAQKGPNDTIANPTNERDRIFSSHFPLPDYLDLSNFFLRKYDAYLKLSNTMTQAREQMMTEQTKKQKQQIKEAAKPTRTKE